MQNTGTALTESSTNEIVLLVNPVQAAALTVCASTGAAREVALQVSSSVESLNEYARIAGRLPYIPTKEDLQLRAVVGDISATVGQEELKTFYRRMGVNLAHVKNTQIQEDQTHLTGHPIETRAMERYFPGISNLEDEKIMQILQTVEGDLGKIIGFVHKVHTRKDFEAGLMEKRQGKRVNLAESMLMVLCNIASGNQEYFSPEKVTLFRQLKERYDLQVDLTNLRTIEEAHDISCEILALQEDREKNGTTLLKPETSELVIDEGLPDYGSENDLFRQGIVRQLLLNRRNLGTLSLPSSFSDIGGTNTLNAVRGLLRLQALIDPELSERRTSNGVTYVATGRTANIARAIKNWLALSDQSTQKSVELWELQGSLGERSMADYKNERWITPRTNGDAWGTNPEDMTMAEIYGLGDDDF